MANWIPSREQDLVDLAEQWKLELENQAHISAYVWDQTEVTAVLGKVTAFLTARATYQAENSTAKRIAKDEAKDEMLDLMREFANDSIRFNKHMSDDAKLPLGIRPGDHTPTPHLPPTSQPDTVVDNTVNHFEHRVRALNRGRNDATKPDDAYGVRYAWQVGGVKPATGADLGKSKFTRKTTLVVTHTEANKAQTAFYATCYENSKGETGPWSPIEEAVIG